MQAPLGVPHGVRVEQIDCYIYDDDGTSDFTNVQWVWRERAITGTSISARASASTGTSGAATTMYTLTDSTISVVPIDYATHDHMVDITFFANGTSTSLRFYGCRIEYSALDVAP